MHKSKAIYELKTIIEEHTNVDDTADDRGSDAANPATSTRDEDDDNPQADASCPHEVDATEELAIEKDTIQKKIIQSEAELNRIEEICEGKEISKSPTIQPKKGSTTLSTKSLHRELLQEASAVTPHQAEEALMSCSLMKRSAGFVARSCISQETDRMSDKQSKQIMGYGGDVRVLVTTDGKRGHGEPSKTEEKRDVIKTGHDDVTNEGKNQTYHELVEAIYMADVKKHARDSKKRSDKKDSGKGKGTKTKGCEKKKNEDAKTAAERVLGKLTSTSGMLEHKVRDVLKQIKTKTKDIITKIQSSEELMEKQEDKPKEGKKDITNKGEEDTKKNVSGKNNLEDTTQVEGDSTKKKGGCVETLEDITTDVKKEPVCEKKVEDIPKQEVCEEEEEPEPPKVEEKKPEVKPVEVKPKKPILKRERPGKPWKDAAYDYTNSSCSRLTGQLRVTRCGRKPGDFVLHPGTDEKEERSLDVASQAESDEEGEGDLEPEADECECRRLMEEERKKKKKQEARELKKKQKAAEAGKKRDRSKSRKESEPQEDVELECCQTKPPPGQEQDQDGKKLKGKQKRLKKKKPRKKTKKHAEQGKPVVDSPQATKEQQESAKFDDTRDFGQSDSAKQQSDSSSMEADQCVYTGMFEDDKRRVDLVIVVSESEKHAKMKFDLLAGLVAMGVQLEFESGEVPSSDMFVKLHAPDDVLDKYAGMLEARRYYKGAHENLMTDKVSLLAEMCRLKHEPEWLKSVRSRNVPPLRYSNEERSYVVLMMLRHQCAELGYQLERLLILGILLDIYALHDGPYYCPQQKNYRVYNCRQVLFLNWAGARNMFKYQPMHIIHEYFGSKIAFYFMFYGFYNKALIFSSLWGIFMTLVYFIKDREYFEPLRTYGCAYGSFRTREWKIKNETWSEHRLTLLDEEHHQGNFICEGEEKITVCHMTLLEDLCIGMQFRRITDNPYMILYSAGISLWALLFLTFWKRTERYWQWMWELNLFPKHQLFRTIGKAEGCGHLKPLNREKKKWNPKHVINGFLATCAWLLLLAIMFVAIMYAHVEWLKPLTVTLGELDKESKQFDQILTAPSEVSEAMDLGLLALLALVVLILLFVLEKIFHSAAYIVTSQFEKYLTYERFEKSLISKYFFYSFLFASSLTVYFGWLKGVFYNGLLDVWDATVNVTTPWASYEVPTPNISEYVTHVARRLLTLNCAQFTCFHEGIIVFIVTLLFREVIVKIITMIASNSTKKVAAWRLRAMTTCEREYQLRPVTERQVVEHFNTLFIQLALVTLFAPMFPLAPLLALAVNSLDMRSKASMYTMRHRRALLFRSAGIGYWNHVLKLVCYAAPLFHALTITRTEIFKKYIYYKYRLEFWKKYTIIWMDYITTILAYNIHKDAAMVHHAGFQKVNKDRVASAINESFVFRKTEYHTDIGTNHHFFNKFGRVDGFYEQMTDRVENEWPHQWNFIGENYSFNTPHPAHYHMKLLKASFVVIYVILFAALSVMLWQLVRRCPGGVARRQQRERVLRRHHQHRLTHLRHHRA